MAPIASIDFPMVIEIIQLLFPVALILAMVLITVVFQRLLNKVFSQNFRKLHPTIYDDADAFADKGSPTSTFFLQPGIHSSHHLGGTTTTTTTTTTSPSFSSTIRNTKKDKVDEQLRVEQARKKEEEEREVRMAKLRADWPRLKAQYLGEKQQWAKLKHIMSTLQLPSPPQDLKVDINPEAFKALTQQMEKVPLSSIPSLIKTINQQYPSTVRIADCQ